MHCHLSQVTAKSLNLNKPAPGGRRRRKTEFEPPKLNLLNAPGSNKTQSEISLGSAPDPALPMRRSLSDTDNNEVIAAKMQAAKEKSWGPMTLYFGCRRSNQDYIYKDEVMRAKVSGVLSEVNVGFSRDLKLPKVRMLSVV